MEHLKGFYSGIILLGLLIGGCKSGEDAAFSGNNADNGLPPLSQPGNTWNNPGEGLKGNPLDDWTPVPGIKFPVIYFACDQYSIGKDQFSRLEQVAAYLKQHPDICVIIEGHCDERGSDEYNRALGEKRAITVRNWFNAKGIADSRFRTISYGEERPAVQGRDEAAWSQNRRAELIAARVRK